MKKQLSMPFFINSFYLWGEVGSGKTQYLNIWLKNNNLVKEIKALEKIKNDNGKIYCFDGVNESDTFDIKQLKNTLKTCNKVFVIFSGWDRYSGFPNYNINSSEEFVNTIGWLKIKHDCNIIDDNFSIREKFIMCVKPKNLDKIKKLQKHSLMWKAFENIFEKNEKVKNYFKKIIEKNPEYIEEEKNNEFKWLKQKKLIQYNNNRKKWVYSHKNIVYYLFFRKKEDIISRIKNLNLNSDDHIEYVKNNPPQFINWWFGTNKYTKDKERINKLVLFLKNNKIPISVKSHEIIDNLEDDNILYLPLNFEDLKILAKNKKYNRMYKEYLKENIDANKDLNKNDLGACDIAYFIYSIHKSIEKPIIWIKYTPKKIVNSIDNNFPRIMNSMIITNFHKEKEIEWNNDNERYQMLNYILGRYIQGYIDCNFSALTISKLKDILWCKWDKKNKLEFHDFLTKHYDKMKDKYGEKILEYSKFFYALIYCGRGSVSIYDASHQKFKEFKEEIDDNRYKIIILSMYVLFEEKYNNISYEDMHKYYDIYKNGDLPKTKQITPVFEKFMMFFFNRYIYFYHNLPVYNEEFDNKIPLIDYKIPLITNKNKEQEVNTINKEIKKYLLENTNLLNLTWKINIKYPNDIVWWFSNKFKINSCITIINYERYDLYDFYTPNDCVYALEIKQQLQEEPKVYDPSGVKYIIKNNQHIIVSKNTKRKITKFIVHYKIFGDSVQNIICDKIFIIDLNKDNIKTTEINMQKFRYYDVDKYKYANIHYQLAIIQNHQFYENRLLPIIKNNFKK